MSDESLAMDVRYGWCRADRVIGGWGYPLMRRRKPTVPVVIPRDERFTLRGHFTSQQLPPSVPNPRKKIGHSVKYVSPSARIGNPTPIPRRLALFFGVGGRVGWRK